LSGSALGTTCGVRPASTTHNVQALGATGQIINTVFDKMKSTPMTKGEARNLVQSLLEKTAARL
jgi:hypothetical protein